MATPGIPVCIWPMAVGFDICCDGNALIGLGKGSFSWNCKGREDDMDGLCSETRSSHTGLFDGFAGTEGASGGGCGDSGNGCDTDRLACGGVAVGGGR